MFHTHFLHVVSTTHGKVVSQNKENPEYRPQHTINLMKGIPTKVPRILRKPPYDVHRGSEFHISSSPTTANPAPTELLPSKIPALALSIIVFTITTIGYILGLYWDNGKENGSYRDYRDYKGYIGII